MAADLYKRWTLHILYPSRYRRLVKDRAVRDLADARFIFVNDSSYLIGALPLRPET